MPEDSIDGCYHCYHLETMPQLLVRNLDASVVKLLRRRAAAHGISAEEEHRRILKEALTLPAKRPETLMEFLLSPEGCAPDVDLELERSSDAEAGRDIQF